MTSRFLDIVTLPIKQKYWILTLEVQEIHEHDILQLVPVNSLSLLQSA